MISRTILTPAQRELAAKLCDALKDHPLEDANRAMTSIMAATLNDRLAGDDALDQAAYWANELFDLVSDGQRGELITDRSLQ